jgi:putative membrane protein
MKKFFQLCLLAAALSFAIVSCNGDKADQTADNKNPGNTDSTSTGSTNHNNVDNDDATFLSEAAYGGMKEVAGGKIAQQKGQSKDIKDLGSMMVTDHTAMGEKIKALAAKKNVQLPDSLSSDDMDNIRNNKKTGADFDKDYADDMVDDHEKDIKKFEDEAQNGKDPDIKALANEALPKLRHHLEMAKAAKAKVKG